MSDHVAIVDLKPSPGARDPLSSKMDCLFEKTKAKDWPEFVRLLLAAVSDARFLALTKTPRAEIGAQLESKIDSIRRMMSEQARKNRLRVDYEEAIAEFIGFCLSGDKGRIWRKGSATDFAQMLDDRSGDGDPTSDDRQASPPPPSTANLDSQRDGASWSLIESLCSIILFGNQDGRTDLDFELSGQPTSVTIADETGRRVLLQREVVVKHCVVELHLGGAEIHGGLTALKRAVSSFLRRPDARHLMIDVGGSARAPRLTVQVREGAIGVARPLLGPPSTETGEAQTVCYLVEVRPGTRLTALVRIYGTELQDLEPAHEALVGSEEADAEPAVASGRGRPLAVDDRVRIMMHLWKLAEHAKRNPDEREPGVLTLSYDARSFVERKGG